MRWSMKKSAQIYVGGGDSHFRLTFSILLASVIAMAMIGTFIVFEGEDHEVSGEISGTCGDGLTWTIDDSGKLTITGTGEMDTHGWDDNANAVRSVVIDDGVTNIVSYAFMNCSNLTSVTIPDSVTSIGSYAFTYCSGLTTVTIPDTVTSIGTWSFSDCSGLTTVTIPSSVTSIKEHVFFGCSGLTSVTIPDSVTSIGNSAFFGCSGLTTVTIPSNVTSIGKYAFYGCSSLTSVTIPDTVTSIGESAFVDCFSLTEVGVDGSNSSYSSESGVLFSKSKTKLISYPAGKTGTTYTIPDTVTSIGEYAFCGCSGLTSVTIPNTVTSIGKYAFMDCSGLTTMTIPSSVTKIEDYVFRDCSGLTSVTIPDSVTSIGGCAFYGCSRLTSVTIPDSVTSIGGSAFGKCGSLTSVTIPSSVTNIEAEAYADCVSLTGIEVSESNTCYSSVDGVLFDKNKTQLIAYPAGNTGTTYTIPDTVTKIWESGFSGCVALKTLTIPASVTEIEEDDFSLFGSVSLSWIEVNASNQNYSSDNGILFNKDKTELLRCPVGRTGSIDSIPDTVTSIGEQAFMDCSGLTSVTIPETITDIGRDAFSGCSGLTSVTIPSRVTSIGIATFVDCTGLTSVTIPNSVTSIGSFAFNQCTALTSITIPDSVTSIGNYAFWNCTGLTSVTIPDSVTSLGYYAFLGCENLLEINLWQFPLSYYPTFPEHTFFSEDGKLLDQSNDQNFIGYKFIGVTADRMIRSGPAETSKHNITYNLNGGSGEAPTQEPVQKGAKFEVKGYTGTRTGYTFGGWAYNGSTYKAGDLIEMGTSDIMLTAIWNPNAHAVTYDIGEGSGGAPTQEPVQEGAKFEIKNYTGTRTGYKFAGWSWNGETYQPGDKMEMGISDIVLEAIWSKNQIFVPIPDNRDDEPIIPVFPDQTSKDSNDDSTSAAIIAAGCVVVLLAIIVLVGSARIRR